MLRLLHASSQQVRSATFSCWRVYVLLCAHGPPIILSCLPLLPLSAWLPFLLQWPVSLPACYKLKCGQHTLLHPQAGKPVVAGFSCVLT